MNFYKHHIGDYGKKTAHLSLAEHGAYLLMLQTYYATEKPLPTGKPLYRLLRAESKIEREAVDAIAAQFWRVTDAGLTNDRADEEIERAASQRAINRELGKRGGRPKLTESVNEPQSESATESVNEQKTNRNPPKTPDSRLQTPDKDSEKILRPPKAAHAPESDAIRKVFPVRSGSQPWTRAEKAINARRGEGHTWDQLIAGTERYARFCEATGKVRTEYVMQAATFFGPDKRFLEPWTPPPSKAQSKQDANVIASQEWLGATQ